MYLSYFDKFYDMEPYLFIDEEGYTFLWPQGTNLNKRDML